jgi:hypothetical protein
MAKQEPDAIKCHKDSFLFVGTAGMRNSPEEVLLELYRSVFFKRIGEGSAQELLPDNNGLTPYESYTLKAFRGRQKKQGSRENYYACPYPAIAKAGWPRKKTDTPIKHFFIGGPIAQYVFGHAAEDKETQYQEIDLPRIAKALRGHNVDGDHVEFFAAAIGAAEGELNLEEAGERFLDISKSNIGKGGGPLEIGEDADPLAERIYHDLLELCGMEENVARYYWIQLLLGFLSLSSSIWLLSQMRLTLLVLEWLVLAIEQEEVPGEAKIKDAFRNRYQGLFYPSSSAKREVFEHIENYMKARVELVLLLNELKETKVIDAETPIPSRPDKVVEYLARASGGAGNFKAHLKEKFNVETTQQFLTRKGEGYGAWRKPLKSGQGKNYIEYLRLLQKPQETGINESYLLVPERQRDLRNKIWFKVMPGPITLQLLLFFTWRKKERAGFLGRATLGDLVDTFKGYGIEYNESEAGIELLKGELLRSGLMKGSPDAGLSAQLEKPAAFNLT